jgi:mitochondrial fission protein ELM1
LPRALPTLSAWVVTDGKAGDQGQCLGVTEALGLRAEIRRVAPRPPFTWLMPWGPLDPREAPGRTGSPIAPPFPDLLVASGRRAVPYLRAVKRVSARRTFTVFLKDPRTGPNTADLIWAPTHDDIEGPNVLKTLTSPHRFSASSLAGARKSPDPRLEGLAHPRVAVLVGGDSRHGRFGEADMLRLVDCLDALSRGGASLMITASRRTPAALRQRLAALVKARDGFLWDGTGENPYIAMLALADAVVVTADSANMVGEAAATGAPVLLFRLPRTYAKHERFFKALEAGGILQAFEGRLEGAPYEPLNSTPAIAEAVAAGLARHRRALGLDA